MSNVTVYQHSALGTQRASTQIRNAAGGDLMVRLPEIGKIKIGGKGRMIEREGKPTFQAPVKLPYFRVTTMERDAEALGNFKMDKAVHGEIGPQPVAVPIMLLYNDPHLFWMSRFVAYLGRRAWCSGDGVQAMRLVNPEADVPEYKPRTCPCPNLSPDYKGGSGPTCKWNGRLEAVVRVAPRVGGVWVFRTTSQHSVLGITSSLKLIQGVTGGKLSGLPLMLTITPRTVEVTPGRQQTVYIVGVEFNGSLDELREIGYQAALKEAQAGVQRANMEKIALASLDIPLLGHDDGDESSDIADEFYHEQAAAADGATIVSHDPETGEVQEQSGGGDILDQLAGQSDVEYDDGESPEPKAGQDADQQAAKAQAKPVAGQGESDPMKDAKPAAKEQPKGGGDPRPEPPGDSGDLGF